GTKPSSFYLERFNEADLRIAGEERTAPTRVGEGDLEFEVHIPVEFGAIRADLCAHARSALAQVVAMDDAARASNADSEDDEQLAALSVYAFHAELEYFSTTVNSQWTEFFTLAADGGWHHRGKALPWMQTWLTKNAPALLAIDAAYGDHASAAAGVYFADWASDTALRTFSVRVDGAPPTYQPGEFYKRELPMLMALLDQAPMPVSTIVVDGYAWLSGDGRPGLGARLYEALVRRVPVIGVAKTRFHDETWSQPVRRGASDAPLYVTGAGIDRTDSARRIARMSGPGRIPALLKHADALARSALSG
ncbi:MAG: endonuclease V, partial [Vitreimonas sp.]